MFRVAVLAVVFTLTAQQAVAKNETITMYPDATVPGWAVKMSLRIATREWQVCQHAGEPSIEWIYSTELLGEAGHAWPANCRIAVNTASYPVHWVGPFCDTVVHEYGHVAGYRDPLNVQDPAHSHQAGRIMSADGFYVQSNGAWSGVHWMCRPVARRAARELRKARDNARHHRPAKWKPGMHRGSLTS